MSSQCGAPPLWAKVVVDQTQGGYVTPALDTSTAVNGKLQTVLVLSVQKGC